MNKNLLAKTILIIAVLIIFLFGIVGIPSSFTPQGFWPRCSSAFIWVWI